MARRKKEEVVIIDQELQPTVLATIEEKRSSLIVVFILFIIFIGVAFFLPEISLKVEQYLDKGPVGTPIVNNQSQEEDKTILKYRLDDEIDKDNYKINNFKLENNKLSFDIVNKTTKEIDLYTEQYFLEIYNNTSLLQRIKLEDKVPASGSISKSYTIDGEITHFFYEILNQEDYPEENILIDDEYEKENIKCSLGDETYNYIFDDEKKLHTIEFQIIKSTSDVDYQNLYTTYQTQYNDFGSIKGVIPSFTSDASGFVYSHTVDLSNTDISKLGSYNYYNKDTESKIVAYEMDARGYTCE